MGGLCSKTSDSHKRFSSACSSNHSSGRAMDHTCTLAESMKNQTRLSSLELQKSSAVKSQEPTMIKNSAAKCELSLTKIESGSVDLYDGIPRYPRAHSQKSRSTRTKEGIGRAGTLGLEKAVKVLDTLGSSMTNLNRNSGFASGVTIKGNELSILAFEVANTIVKGNSLMESVSARNIQQLKDIVLSSEGVQFLVSKDMDELLKMVTMDKREELKIFAGEVIRFGNRCKDPQWHNLDRYLEKHNKEPPRQLREEAEFVMQHFMTLVHHTAELYQELNTLDKLEQEHEHKQTDSNSNATHKGEVLATLKLELKGQKKKVNSLKKKSLWSKSMEEVMEKLVDIVLFLNREINNAFGVTNANMDSKGPLSIQRRLGPAGLSLHYANIVQQIDSIVARSTAVPSSTREFLYQNLPPRIKSCLRSRLQTFDVKEEVVLDTLTVSEIKTEMEKTLCWLAPIASNTSKAHHGFGWVGEWASTRNEVNEKHNGPIEITRIETLHYADKQKTDDCILQLLLWLTYMTKQYKVVPKGNGMVSMNAQGKEQQLTTKRTNHPPPTKVIEDKDKNMLRDISNRKRTLGLSKSQNYECTKLRLRKHDRLSKSSGHWPASNGDGFLPLKRLCSNMQVVDFKFEKQRAMDAIDGVNSTVSGKPLSLE